MALRLSGVVTGDPIAADAAPNTTEPPVSRVFTTPIKGGVNFGGTCDVLLFLEDGTSIDVTAWVKTLNDTWFEFNTTALTVPDLEVGTISALPPDAEVFLQLTAPVGNPTSFGFACV